MSVNYIHETIVKDVIDIAQDIKDSDEVQFVKNKQNGSSFKSIASKAEGLTMVFPFIASRNADIDSVSMAAKAQERKCVNLLQMLFSAANITDAKNGEEFIKKFHTNLNPGKLSVDQFMDIMDDFVNENGLLPQDTGAWNDYKAIQEDMRAMNVYFERPINETEIADFGISHRTGEAVIVPPMDTFNEAEDDLGERRFKWERQKADRDFQFNNMKQGDTNFWNQMKMNQSDSQFGARMASDQERFNHQVSNDERNYKLSQNRDARDQAKLDRDMAKGDIEILKLKADISRNRLVDQDVKKSNELTPTLMSVNFVSTAEDGYAIQSAAIIGVKCKIYAVDGQDIIDRLKSKSRNGNVMLNLIRASTREISFFRDFLFAIDQAKIDAISQSRRGSSSKLWKVLERRALKSKIRRSLAMSNDATAISTLCVTSDEVEFMKKTEYIDLENPRVIRQIMEGYNFMSFIILDDNLEIAKFIYDTGDDNFEVLTYNNLERESKDNTKKIINLMTKMNR